MSRKEFHCLPTFTVGRCFHCPLPCEKYNERKRKSVKVTAEMCRLS